MHTLPLTLLPLLLLAPSIDGWLGIYLDNEHTEAVVAEVLPDSPAARAGLQAGDVLLAVGETKTGDREAFVAAIRAAKPGDRISIQLRRDGREQVVMVKLGTRPDAAAPSAPTAPQPPATGASKPAPAVEVAPAQVAPPAARGYLGVSVREEDAGVVVDRVLADGPAKDRLRAGDRILSIDGKQVGGLDDLDRGLGQRGPGTKIELQVQGADASSPRAVSITLGRRPGSREGTAPTTDAQVEATKVEVVKATAPKIETARVAPLAPKPKARAELPSTETLPPAPAPVAPPKPTSGGEGAAAEADLEAQLAALRAELAELRRQLEQLRRQGRE